MLEQVARQSRVDCFGEAEETSGWCAVMCASCWDGLSDEVQELVSDQVDDVVDVDAVRGGVGVGGHLASDLCIIPCTGHDSDAEVLVGWPDDDVQVPEGGKGLEVLSGQVESRVATSKVVARVFHALRHCCVETVEDGLQNHVAFWGEPLRVGNSELALRTRAVREEGSK